VDGTVAGVGVVGRSGSKALHARENEANPAKINQGIERVFRFILSSM
jgi:hypothetical protein